MHRPSRIVTATVTAVVALGAAGERAATDRGSPDIAAATTRPTAVAIASRPSIDVKDARGVRHPNHEARPRWLDTRWEATASASTRSRAADQVTRRRAKTDEKAHPKVQFAHTNDRSTIVVMPVRRFVSSSCRDIPAAGTATIEGRG